MYPTLFCHPTCRPTLACVACTQYFLAAAVSPPPSVHASCSLYYFFQPLSPISSTHANCSLSCLVTLSFRYLQYMVKCSLSCSATPSSFTTSTCPLCIALFALPAPCCPVHANWTVALGVLPTSPFAPVSSTTRLSSIMFCHLYPSPLYMLLVAYPVFAPPFPPTSSTFQL